MFGGPPNVAPASDPPSRARQAPGTTSAGHGFLRIDGGFGAGSAHPDRDCPWRILRLRLPIIRLQCYEGLDIAEAVYEWNYPRQLLAIRLAEAAGNPLGADDLFRRDYLIERPLLRALEHSGPRPAILLIDEIDRADEHFEAFCWNCWPGGRSPFRRSAPFVRRCRRSPSSPPTGPETCTTR